MNKQINQQTYKQINLYACKLWTSLHNARINVLNVILHQQMNDRTKNE